MKARPTTNRRRFFRVGAHAVEFAFAAPILFFFVMTSFEMARMHMVRHTIDNAVYEGCRRGLVMGSTSTDVTNRVNSILMAGGVRSPTTTSTITSDAVTVTTSVSMNNNSWVAPVFFKDKNINVSLTLNRR